MAHLPSTLESLINELVKMPGIGRRSASRIAFYIMHAPKPQIQKLVASIVKAKESIRFCSKCNNLSDADICDICSNGARDKGQLCIVEGPNDVAVVEASGMFKGYYHVLLGSIAPLEGKGPEDLKIDGLMHKIRSGAVKEVIIATDSDTEGETTALFLARLIKPAGVRVSRIGQGIPMGSNIEYADAHTISQAIEHRRDIKD